MAVATERACPQCGTTLPVADGYVTWCHACDWNLNAPEPVPTPRRLGRIYDAAGRRLGERLAARLLAEERLEPRLTPAKLAAYGVALFVHAFWLGLGVGGIALVALTFPNPFLIAAGALMMASAVLMRPRFGELPEEGVLTRLKVPTLYALADDVADALGTPRVDVIAVDHVFNASWSIVGVRRRRVLQLGGPLLAGLEPQERVALIAHELAHARNGDSTRGLIVGSAIGALEQLYLLLAPEEGAEWEFGGIDALANGAMWVLSRPVLGVLLLELHLVLRDSQRAEFLADAQAAEVAGAEATVALSEKMLLEPTFRSVVQHAAHGDVEPGEVLRDVARLHVGAAARTRAPAPCRAARGGAPVRNPSTDGAADRAARGTSRPRAPRRARRRARGGARSRARRARASDRPAPCRRAPRLPVLLKSSLASRPTRRRGGRAPPLSVALRRQAAATLAPPRRP